MFLYILENDTIDKMYIGTTNNPERRLIEHNKNTNKYTGKIKGIWKMIFTKAYLSNKEARKEEIRLKKAKNKKYILWYIKQFSGR